MSESLALDQEKITSAVKRLCDAKLNSNEMRNTDWRTVFPFACYFYPGRGCPGWDAGGICGRVGNRIPVDETATPVKL